MPIDDGSDWPAVTRRELPTFDVPQRDGTTVTLDFTTMGPFGDFAFTARMTRVDGTVRERIYGAHHTEEPAIFVEILQHWARVEHPDDILAGLDRAEVVLRFLTEGLESTTRSENEFGDLLRRSIVPLADMDFLPTDHEHGDELGDTIVLASSGADLRWISRCNPRTTFTVPPSHLWVFVTGMMWRTYDSDGIPLTRLNTVAYETAVAAFRRAIGSRSQTQRQPESPKAADGEDQGHDRAVASELVQSLCELLGTRLVAYLSSVPDTRTVREWSDLANARKPSREVIGRLQMAHRVASLINEEDSSAVVQAWFQGRNPLLDDVAPARLLRDSELDIAGPSVMAAARAFAANPENPRTNRGTE